MKHITKPRSGGTFGALLALAALLLTACGGQDGPTGSTEVRVEPATITVLRGATATATVTVGDGYAEAATLAASGVPDDVDVRFDPAFVAPGGSATMTVDASAATATGTFDLAIAATEGDRSGEADATLTVADLEGEGVVVDAFGRPLPGWSVVVEDDAAARTRVDGTFDLAGLAVPYDVTVFDVGSGVVHRYEDLRSASPRLVADPMAFLNVPAGMREGEVGGSFASAVPADHEARICVHVDAVPTVGCGTVGAGGTAFTIGVDWFGPAVVDAEVRAYVYELDASGVPVDVASSASVDAQLEDGATTTIGGPIAPSAPEAPAATFDVDVSAPAGYDLGALIYPPASVVANLPGGAASLPSIAPLATIDDVRVAVPGGDGVTYSVAASGGVAASSGTTERNVFAWDVDVEPGRVALELPDAPDPVAPADGTTVDRDAVFEIDADEDAANLFFFGGGGPVVYVTTRSSTATLPDLAALDPAMAIPSGGIVDWSVASVPEPPESEGDVLRDWRASILALLGYGGGAGADGAMTLTSGGTVTIR